MNKTLLATAVAVLLTAPSVSAIELYKNATTDATLGGYLGVRALNNDSETQLVNGSSRINFNFTHKLSNGWSAFSTLEWGIEPFGDTDLVYNNDSQITSQTSNLFYSRLAYIGLEHDKYGSLSFGKQWGSWYNVVGGTDNAYVWGGAAGGEYNIDGSGSLDGTGRADKAIQYNLTVGKFSLSLQTQLQQNSIDVTAFSNNNVSSTLTFDNTYGGSLSYAITDKLSVAIGANFGKFGGFNATNNSPIDADDEIYGGSITWGNISDEGWYFSANYNRNKYHDTDVDGHLIPESYGVEAFVAYLFDNGIQPYFAYNGLISTADYRFPVANNGSFTTSTVTDSNQEYYVIGTVYFWDPAVLAYIEAQIDNSDYVVDGVKADNNNAVAVGLRYTF
ncbi:porin [Shewanella sp. GXUN23E]|uniref:porin n=1 Tax=Shewanella sp. GXUN23E TaxID=3422498 RepID=UPI003D7E3CFE